MSTLGDRLAGLQWSESSAPNPDRLIVDAVVLMRATHSETGDVTMFLCSTEGTDIITKMGLISAAHAVESGSWGASNWEADTDG